jgi:hypothetical protein
MHELQTLAPAAPAHINCKPLHLNPQPHAEQQPDQQPTHDWPGLGHCLQAERHGLKSSWPRPGLSWPEQLLQAATGAAIP